MALLFIDSCGDHYTTANILSKWDAQSPLIGLPPIVTTGRTGNGLSLYNSPTGSSGLIHNLANNENGLVAGMAFKLDILPQISTPIFYFGDSGTYQVTLCVDCAGRVYVTTGGTTSSSFLNPASLTQIAGATTEGGAIITNNQWYYIEMKVQFSAGSSGMCSVRVNNNLLFSVSGVRTTASSNEYANQFALISSGPGAANTNYYDDIYLANLTGGISDFLGDRHIDCLFPVSDYSVSLDTSTGSDHYSLVNATTPDGDSTYVASATPGDTDLYTLQSLPESIVVVNGMQSVMYARKDDASARSVAPRFSDGTATSNGASISLPQSYGYRLQAFDVSPVDGSPLTPSKVNNLKAGMDIVS